MKCCSKSIDTHPDIIESACRLFFYPKSHGPIPCNLFKMCQNYIKCGIENDNWFKRKHHEYQDAKNKTSPAG